MNSNQGERPDKAHSIGEPDAHVRRGRIITQEVPKVPIQSEGREFDPEKLDDKELERMLRGVQGMAESFLNQLRIRLKEPQEILADAKHAPPEEIEERRRNWRKRVIEVLRKTALPMDAEE